MSKQTIKGVVVKTWATDSFSGGLPVYKMRIRTESGAEYAASRRRYTLIQRGFAVFITADHGNTFGRGFGKPDVGATAQQRGERAHIFRNKDFRDNTAPLYPNAIEWPQIGLPQDYFPLIAPYGACFMPVGKEAVSHGGIALEEVMVPFVRITEAR